MAAVRNCSVELVDYPPHYPDLAPSDHFLLLNMKKKHLAGKQYRTDLQLRAFIEDQDKSFYSNGFQTLHVCNTDGWRGDYVDK